jgi:hypothetical protein
MRAIIKQEGILFRDDLEFGDRIEFIFNYDKVVLIYPYDKKMYPKLESLDEEFIVDKGELKKFDGMWVIGWFWRWGSDGNPMIKMEVDLEILRDKKINDILDELCSN